MNACVALAVLGSIELLQPQATVLAEGNRTLSLRMTAKSDLPVAVDELELGILCAPTAAELGNAPIEIVYRGAGRGAVRVVQQRVSVSLPARGSALVQVVVDLGREAALPQAFQPHLLGYRLQQADAALLLRLVASGTAADEMAAVRTLGLLDDAQGRAAVRMRFAAAELRTALASEVIATIPRRPTTEDLQRRVYAVLALGVLGGPEVAQMLGKLRGEAQLWRFDEALQVIRAARLTGSVWEAPLAYAFPARAAVMADVVDFALAGTVAPKWPQYTR